MNRFLLLCAALLTTVSVCFATPTGELSERILAIDGVVEVKPLAAGKFTERHEVMLTQPLDWSNPNAGYFEQRVLVMHAGYDRPTVVITQGYDAKFGLSEKYRDELSELFDTNIILVEHRYFDRSMPQPCDWQYLTAENSAHDLHQIVNKFREIYPGKWIASGISKGGTTTMLYAAYFPGDVDVYVPYVGPLCTSREDKRFAPFMAQIGTAEDRAVVEAFQIEAFRRKGRLMADFETYCKGNGYVFRLPVDQIYDYCVLEYGFSFWQWGLPASSIPSITISDEELLKALIVGSSPNYFDARNPLSSFFVQAARELGYYPYDLKPFREYTSVRSTRDYLRRMFLPEQMRQMKFSKRLYRKVARYLKQNDPRMIMVYGGIDPWTAPGAGWTVTPNKQNMKLYVQPGGGHRSRIGSLPDSMRREAIETLHGWLEL